MRVLVAVYQHKHGDDVRVYADDESADKWMQEIAAEYWDSVMDTAKPADAHEMATQYFDYCAEIGFEFFNVTGHELEGLKVEA